MAQYNKSFKVCGTCSYWGGERVANSSGTYVTVDPMKKGKCVLPPGKGPYAKRDVQGNHNGCNKYEKWGALR